MALYYRPDSLKEAVRLVNDAGQTNLPLYYSPRAKNLKDWNADGLVDLSLLGLDGITIKKSEVLLGSMLSLEAAAENAELSPLWDGILAKAISYSSTKAMRNLATFGGVLMNPNNPPEVAMALVALGASAVLVHPTGRDTRVPVEEFVKDPQNCVIRAVAIPTNYRTHCVMERISRTEKDTPIVAVIARGDMTQRNAYNLHVVLSGVKEAPYRLTAVENAFAEKPFTLTNIKEAAALSSNEECEIDDFRGSAEYRSAMVEVLVRRALTGLRKSAQA